MKITTKGRYAIHILYDLAVNGTEHPVSVKEMATRQEISVKYTEQIISILNKAGYVSSSRGFQGGYRLTKPLNEYVIGDILRLTEGSLAPVACVEEEGSVLRPPRIPAPNSRNARRSCSGKKSIRRSETWSIM